MATFCQECYNVNEVSVKIMLVRSMNSFVLMSPGYKVTIESAIMYVTKSFWLTPKRWKTLLKNYTRNSSLVSFRVTHRPDG